MKALLAVAVALLCGGASAQDSRAVCLGFCDADAKTCREGTHPDAWAAASTLLFLHGSWSPAPDKREQAAGEADKDRRAHSQECGDSRQVCRQKCGTPVAAPAPDSAASAPN